MKRTPFRRALALAAALLLAAGCGAEQAAPPPEQGMAAPPAALDLSGLGYRRGAPDAPVTVVEFSDFGCPYCGRFALETLPELDREFIQAGQVQWQYIPFVMGSFPNGERAALAAECAGEQDRFWPMHDLLYARQREWRRSGGGDADALFGRYAREVGLDERAFGACYGAAAPAARIEQANRAAARLGVRATPSFFVNGQRVQGALPLEQFRQILHWSGAGAD